MLKEVYLKYFWQMSVIWGKLFNLCRLKFLLSVKQWMASNLDLGLLQIESFFFY